jgi:hypothetical protein
MPDERVHLGYQECVECSSVEPYSAHVVYPHKTGAFVQPVSSSVKKDLQRLDRRAVKVGGKINAPQAREWKMPEPKKQKVSPQPKQKVFTNQVTFNDSFKQCIDTYKQKGYVVTVNYLKQLYKKNKITLTTKTQLVNVLTSIHMLDRKTRKKYFRRINA